MNDNHTDAGTHWGECKRCHRWHLTTVRRRAIVLIPHCDIIGHRLCTGSLRKPEQIVIGPSPSEAAA